MIINQEFRGQRLLATTENFGYKAWLSFHINIQDILNISWEVCRKRWEGNYTLIHIRVCVYIYLTSPNLLFDDVIHHLFQWKQQVLNMCSIIMYFYTNFLNSCDWKKELCLTGWFTVRSGDQVLYSLLWLAGRERK